MRIFRNIDAIPDKNVVLTIGTFDGVHLAHRALISSIVEVALEAQKDSMLITFSPHPRTFVSAEDTPPIELLTSTTEKIELLKDTGLDILLIQNFDRQFSEIDAEEFVDEYLISKLRPSCIIIGYDHKFGKNREGDIDLLRSKSDQGGFEVMEIPRIILDDLAVNSTKIRQHLRSGDVKLANRLLGRPYSIRGMVVRGLQNGRKMGFPTANIKPDSPEKLIPTDGVYSVEVMIGDEIYRGALNIGYRPSVDRSLSHTIEVYILDFDEDIYGREIEVRFLDFVRPEMKFDDLESLQAQIAEDVSVVARR